MTPARRGIRIKALVGQLLNLMAAILMIRNSTMLVIVTLLLAGAPCAVAQAPPQKTDAPKSTKADPPKKPTFAEAVRVSTDDALANVARRKAADTDAKRQDPSGDAVVEFHEAPPSSASPKGSALSKDSKKAPLKDIHGEAHGLAGSGVNQEGGRVGGHSKDGKASIFIDANRAETSPSH